MKKLVNIKLSDAQVRLLRRCVRDENSRGRIYVSGRELISVDLLTDLELVRQGNEREAIYCEILPRGRTWLRINYRK